MRIIKDLGELSLINKPSAVALGNFDGVHLGHRSLIKSCVEESRANQWEPCACTFEPHPSLVLSLTVEA